MTPDRYLERSANISRRVKILRGQVDAHVAVHGNTNNPVVRPVLEAYQAAIDELATLNKEYFGNA